MIRSGTQISNRSGYYEGGVPNSQNPASTSPSDQYESQYASGYPSYMDAYSAAMTPPASVSPRDKFPLTNQEKYPHPGISDTAAFSEAAAAAAAAAMPHMHHYDHLPLKPQVFVHPGVDYDQQQVYHASGFHLYHKSPGSHHHPASSTSWYPQPNT